MLEQELLQIQGVPTYFYLFLQNLDRFCWSSGYIENCSQFTWQAGKWIFRMEHHVVVVATVAKLLFELKFVRRPQRKFGPSFPTKTKLVMATYFVYTYSKMKQSKTWLTPFHIWVICTIFFSEPTKYLSFQISTLSNSRYIPTLWEM